MKYENPRSDVKIDLGSLNDVEKRFYLQAMKKVKQNTDWFEFDDFAFGMRSPLFSRNKSDLDVLLDPLYLALEDMSLSLGIRLGWIARAGKRRHSGQVRNAKAEQRVLVGSGKGR
jgi:hypothetical protein